MMNKNPLAFLAAAESGRPRTDATRTVLRRNYKTFARRSLRGALAAAVVFGAPFVQSSSAFAANGQPSSSPQQAYLLTSTDGSNFSHSATDLRLFDHIGHVVPSDVSQDQIWLRSAAPSDGRLRIEISNITTDNIELAKHSSIDIGFDSGTASPPFYLSDGLEVGKCFVIDSGKVLKPGETTKLISHLRVAPQLGDEHGNDGMLGNLEFSIKASLFDASIPKDSEVFETCTNLPDPQPKPSKSPDLAFTGGALASATILGAGLVGVLGGAMIWVLRVVTRRNTGE